MAYRRRLCRVTSHVTSSPAAFVGEKFTILVTGCTSGLGLALVEQYVEQGHTVIGCGRRADRIADLSERFPSAIFAVVDASDEAAVKDWSESLTAAGHKVDVLINNAGVGAGAGLKVWEVPAEDWTSVLNVNVHGILHMIRYFVPPMVESNKGFIVNISSGLGHSSNPTNAVYSTSKWAVESLSKSLALGLPEGCMCVPLAPGVVRTEMNPNPRFPTAKEWSAVAAPWILNLWTSPAARDFNGASMCVPGYYTSVYSSTWSIPMNHPLNTDFVAPQ